MDVYDTVQLRLSADTIRKLLALSVKDNIDQDTTQFDLGVMHTQERLARILAKDIHHSLSQQPAKALLDRVRQNA